MSVPDRQLVTDALKATLVAGTGKQVGDHKAPLDAVSPYCVLHVVAGGRFWGAPLIAPDAQADFVFQVDAVSGPVRDANGQIVTKATRKQAEWMADRVRRSVLARTSTGAFQVALTPPTGWIVADRAPDGGAGGVQVEGVPPNEVFSVAERFVLRVVPA